MYVVLVVYVCMQYVIFTYNDCCRLVYVEALSKEN